MAKKKKLTVSVIDRKLKGGDVHKLYSMMDELIGAYHTHLAELKVALAWAYGWSEDADGRIKLGQCRKASDLDRQLHEYDFVILLNHEVVNKAAFTEQHVRALIDHELCHAQIALGEADEPKKTEDGRFVTRIRKHDVEEFGEIIDRHGVWKSDLQAFAASIMKAAQSPLFAEEQPPASRMRIERGA